MNYKIFLVLESNVLKDPVHSKIKYVIVTYSKDNPMDNCI